MEPPKIRGYTAQSSLVHGLYVTPFGESASVGKNEIQIIVNEGVIGDRHGGRRLSDVREDVLRKIGVGKEVEMANVRQISIVSYEAMSEIADSMGVSLYGPSHIYPSLLGANICLNGIDVNAVPTGSLLTFCTQKKQIEFRKAVIAVWRENEPCHIPHDNIIRDMIDRGIWDTSISPKVPFAQAAKGKRGIVGFTYCSGKIKEGDTCVAYIPDS